VDLLKAGIRQSAVPSGPNTGPGPVYRTPGREVGGVLPKKGEKPEGGDGRVHLATALRWASGTYLHRRLFSFHTGRPVLEEPDAL